MKILHILNGPNLNLLGVREPDIYGYTAFEDYLDRLRDIFSDCEIVYFQSNAEGELIDYLHEVGFHSHGIVLNPGALGHYAYALADAISAIEAPVIEVHISNLYRRESFRQQSVTAPVCDGFICGLGLDGYRLALAHLCAVK